MQSEFGGTFSGSSYEMQSTADVEAEEFLLSVHSNYFNRIKDFMFLEEIHKPTLLELSLLIEAEYYAPKIAPLRTELRQSISLFKLPDLKWRLNKKIEDIKDAKIKKQVTNFLNQPFMGYSHVAHKAGGGAGSGGSNLTSPMETSDNTDNETSTEFPPVGPKSWRNFE